MSLRLEREILRIQRSLAPAPLAGKKRFLLPPGRKQANLSPTRALRISLPASARLSQKFRHHWLAIACSGKLETALKNGTKNEPGYRAPFRSPAKQIIYGWARKRAQKTDPIFDPFSNPLVMNSAAPCPAFCEGAYGHKQAKSWRGLAYYNSATKSTNNFERRNQSRRCKQQVKLSTQKEFAQMILYAIIRVTLRSSAVTQILSQNVV